MMSERIIKLVSICPLMLAFLLLMVSCGSPSIQQTLSVNPSEGTQNSPNQASSPYVFQTAQVDQSVVQVWESNELAATGIVVGDGSQVLTVLSWVISTPSDLTIVVSGVGKFPAEVVNLDSRTGVTLLKADGLKLPTVSVGDTSSLQVGQKAFLRDWYIDQNESTSNVPIFREIPVIIGESADNTPLPISLQMTDEMKKESPILIIGQGAELIDKSGKVIGLDIGSPAEFFGPIPPGAIRPFYVEGAVKINDALQLLSPGYSNQPWANGPLQFIAVTSQATASRSGYAVQNYADVTAAIAEVLNKTGDPLDESEYQQYQMSADSSAEADTLTVVYPRTVNLTDASGKTVAQAKWVAIQWDLPRSQPDRLYFGNAAGVVLGGFIINGDISNLEKVSDQLFYHYP